VRVCPSNRVQHPAVLPYRIQLRQDFPSVPCCTRSNPSSLPSAKSRTRSARRAERARTPADTDISPLDDAGVVAESSSVSTSGAAPPTRPLGPSRSMSATPTGRVVQLSPPRGRVHDHLVASRVRDRPLQPSCLWACSAPPTRRKNGRAWCEVLVVPVERVGRTTTFPRLPGFPSVPPSLAAMPWSGKAVRTSSVDGPPATRGHGRPSFSRASLVARFSRSPSSADPHEHRAAPRPPLLAVRRAPLSRRSRAGPLKSCAARTACNRVKVGLWPSRSASWPAGGSYVQVGLGRCCRKNPVR